MRYRLEVRNEAGDIETVIEESTVKRLETHFSSLEQAEMGLTLREYVLAKLKEVNKPKDYPNTSMYGI